MNADLHKIIVSFLETCPDVSLKVQLSGLETVERARKLTKEQLLSLLDYVVDSCLTDEDFAHGTRNGFANAAKKMFLLSNVTKKRVF